MVDIKDEELRVVLEDDDKEKPKKKPKKQTSEKEPRITLFSKVKEDPVRQISKLITLSENAMQERQMVWDRHRRKYRRGMYYLRNTASGVPLYFTNYVYSTVETVKANMTANLPDINCSPRGERDDLAADLMTRVLQDSLKTAGLKAATKEVVHHGLTSTLAYYKITFSDIEDGLLVEALPPDDLLVDPKATTLDDARWIIHKRANVPEDEIYAEYGTVPDGDYTPNEADFLGTVGDRDGLYITEGELQAAIDVAQTYDVYECWIRCWEAERENDWYVVTVAGNTPLKEDFSVYAHNSHPFVEWFAVEDYGADNIYHRGVGIIEEIEPLQDRVDALDLKIYKAVSLMSNRQRYINASSGLNVNAMDNIAGRTYKVNGDPSRAVYYDTPPSLAQSVYEYRDRTEMLMQTVSGVYDVTMGRRPTGITAGRAISELKESAETRLADLMDSLAMSMQKLGNKGLQIVLQFFDGERLIQATDADDDKDFVVVDDYPPELQPTPVYVLGADGQAMVDDSGEPVLENPDEEPEVDEELRQMRKQWREANGVALVLSDVSYRWDVNASTDSALPSAKAEKGQVASDLFRLGAIDREALLEAMDFPKRHKILQRLAAEATGKNAGEPGVDSTNGQIDQMMQMLQQMGLPPEMLQQMMQQLSQGTQGQQTGNFQPQITQ